MDVFWRRRSLLCCQLVHVTPGSVAIVHLGYKRLWREWAETGHSYYTHCSNNSIRVWFETLVGPSPTLTHLLHSYRVIIRRILDATIHCQSIMWPLHLTRVAVFEKRFETATKSQILAFLQDSEQELRLSPVVTKVEQDQNDPAWFTVTDSLPMMWGIKTTTTFRCYSEKVDLEQEQGTNNVVWAGMGTWLRCERRVEERDAPPGAASSQKEVWIREKVVVKVRRSW